jgi:hypothetical protein
VDINLLFPADERAYALLTLMDERMPSQRNGIAFDATGHDDPRRPDRVTLRSRPPGIPLRPYDAEHPRDQADHPRDEAQRPRDESGLPRGEAVHPGDDSDHPGDEGTRP